MMPNPLDVAFAALGNNAAAPLLAAEMRQYPSYPGALHDMRRAGRRSRRRLLGREPLLGLAGRASRAVGRRAAIRRAVAGAAGGDADRGVVAPRAECAARLVGRAAPRHLALRQAVVHRRSRSASFRTPTSIRTPRRGPAGAARPVGKRSRPALPDGYGTCHDPLRGVGRRLAVRRDGRGGAGGPAVHGRTDGLHQPGGRRGEESAGSVQPSVPRAGTRSSSLRATTQEIDPTIADVHTKPATATVLHVGTGYPRLMVMTADTCGGPRAYAGVVSAYYEKMTSIRAPDRHGMVQPRSRRRPRRRSSGCRGLVAR